MNIEDFRLHCLSFPGTSEGFPFGEETLVFKVAGKIFALASLDEEPFRVNLKCDPEKAIVLRDTYLAVVPGYHMNKQHWNTISMDGSIDDELLKTWVKDSYELVLSSFSKKKQAEIRET